MYRENIYDVIKAVEQREGVKVAALVIPKNSGLKGYAWEVLKEAGLDLNNAERVTDTELRINNLPILLRRGEDIPQIVTDEFRLQRVILGVTGDDLLDEYRLRNPKNTLMVENTYDWFDEKAKYFRPALCLIGTNLDLNSTPLEARVAINGKYEMTGRLNLTKKPELSGRKFLIGIYSGDLEASVQSGAYDYCIDTVYSGGSIKERQLVEVGIPLRFSDLQVISAFRKNGMGLLELMASEIERGPIIDRTV